MAAPIVKVEVRLTPEEKNAVPNLEKKVEAFQRRYDHMDMREKFRLCLHEAGHAMFFRRLGWSVELLGPYVEYHDGKLRYVLGAVHPTETEIIIRDDMLFLDWEIAKAYVGSYVLVEALTGEPEKKHVIDCDSCDLPRKLNIAPERVSQALEAAKGLILHELRDDRASLLEELGSVICEYELSTFHTDETLLWGWNEFKVDVPGERYSVAFPPTRGYGLLIENGDDLILFVDGAEVKPWETMHGCQPRVILRGAQRKRAPQVVRKWNARVAELQGSLL
jgi:hypothetical protein